MHFYDKGLNVFHSHFHCHDFEEQHTTWTCLFASAAHSGGPSGLCTTRLASKAQIYDPVSSPNVATITQILACEGLATQDDQVSRAANQFSICPGPAHCGSPQAYRLSLHDQKAGYHCFPSEAGTHQGSQVAASASFPLASATSTLNSCRHCRGKVRLCG